MAKEDDVVAAAMAKPILEGLSKADRRSSFFRKAKSIYKRKNSLAWNGYRPTYRNERFHNAAEYGYQTAEQILVPLKKP